MLLQWRHIHKHQRLRVSAKRVSQEHRQPRIAIRHVHGSGRWTFEGTLAADGLNHVAERAERPVDVLCFFQPISDSPGPLQALGSGQVDEGQQS